jgi:hypothetical protein
VLRADEDARVHSAFTIGKIVSPPSRGEARVAIYRMLNGMAFDDQSVKAMTSAYEAILVELKLKDRNDPLTETIASKIILHCQTGGCDAKRLFDLTVSEIQA